MSVRVLVTGSRTWTDARTVYAALEERHAAHGAQLVIVHGACPHGVDELAARWCRRHGVAQEPHPARWHRDGRFDRRAGFARNAAMVDSGPVEVLAFIRAGSPGASHCARYAEARGVPVRRWTAL